MPAILITGFGPFPGAPFNPTEALARGLARLRRPALADTALSAHIFTTSYAAVDRDLPALIARHRPDVLLMFGLAARARTLRIETRARNALALLPDAAGGTLPRRQIVVGAPAALRLPVPAARLVIAARRTRLPVTLSRDAGKYLCNYLIWRAAEAAGRAGGPRLAAFVHVPDIARTPRRPGRRRRFTQADLARAGTAVLLALAAAARR
jgi:pyroglutamyl-peptidase